MQAVYNFNHINILKVAGYFGITENEPFKGTFYFETIKK
jgi:hypothetical protein